jgi:hypothetical protein
MEVSNQGEKSSFAECFSAPAQFHVQSARF